MLIEMFWFGGCPNHHAAADLLRQILEEYGVADEITSIEVSDIETGERVKFAGSPTIRIDGHDIDPTYEDSGDYTLRCRVYMTDTGLKGVPQRDWIQEAVKAAKVSA